MTRITERGGRPVLRVWVLAGALVPALCAGASMASVIESPSHRASVAAAAPAQGSFEVAGWSKKGESGAFKPDPIYGGGRGRDPYGASLDTDPYRGNSNPNNNIRLAPPNAGLHWNPHGKKKGGGKAEAEAPPPNRRRMNPDDQSADNRANRAAARAAEEGGE